jgi:hypothetical protein
MNAMDRAALEQAIYQAIVECLADRAIEKLRTSRKRALVLLTGSDLGLQGAMASLGALRDEGWTMRFVLSAGAQIVLTPERMRGCDAGALLAAAFPAEADTDVDALLGDCGLLLVPTLSMTTAAKVAGGIRDSLASRLVARALERGVAVVAASDGCCPDNPERAARGFMVADAYKVRLRSNLEALQSYGIRLVRAKNLAAAVHGAAATGSVTGNAVSTEPTGAGVGVAGEKRIFSRGDAMRCRDGDLLRLGGNVLVTPLAADELRSRNIRLVQA